MNATPSDRSEEARQKAARRRAIVVGLILVGISLFMYVSFIVKTAVRGP
ncbi:MAG: hypothetical protein AB7E79_15145 [Rhodospirillaceae bacterium]